MTSSRKQDGNAAAFAALFGDEQPPEQTPEQTPEQAQAEALKKGDAAATRAAFKATFPKARETGRTGYAALYEASGALVKRGAQDVGKSVRQGVENVVRASLDII